MSWSAAESCVGRLSGWINQTSVGVSERHSDGCSVRMNHPRNFLGWLQRDA
jgi:hypothetical protein